MRQRRRPIARLVLAGTVAAVLAMTGATRAQAQDPPGEPRQPVPGGSAPDARTVTLITGDRVTVTGDGADLRVLSVRSGTGRAAQFVRRESGAHRYVIPFDALALLDAGRLDPRLFDVAELVANGYDDARRADVPLLVRGAADAVAGTARSAQRAGRPAVERSMPKLGLHSVRTSKATTTAFWNAVRGDAARPSLLAAGVERVWLDGTVRASLDRSVPQVGAPEAWQAGHTGAGVKVAVLDTGYDPDHPDLAGVVVDSRNFSAEPDTRDRAGHGTHVAATIAGTGAASGGRNRGVAPGARLLVGKVLDNDGFGRESDVLAGMEWAVAQGARVVNMSLGGPPTDGTDPMSVAVNDLTRDTGALFVIAAGNSGAEGTVGSPGTADAALTVGSVGKDDRLSGFSSRGPRVGNFGLKPEIVAPGGGIVAARAAGTLAANAVNAHYAQLDGTSMATPHVAGGAAIVAGQHPEWRAEQLKATLVGAAHELTGPDVFAQGAGRLDVNRAVRQGLSATPAALSLGTLAWPHAGTANKHAVRYHNASDQPVTLTLSLTSTKRDGSAAPAGLFALDRDQLTVPARGSAEATVVVTATGERVGRYVGRLTARAADRIVTTPLAVEVEAPTHTLTVRGLGRTGAQGPTIVDAQHLDGGFLTGSSAWDGVVELRVPAGRYRITALIFGQRPAGVPNDVTTFARDAIVVDRDVEVTVDARSGRPVTDRVDEPDARRGQVAYGLSSDVSGPDGRTSALTAYTDQTGVVADLYAVGSAPMPGLRTVYAAYWERPVITLARTGPDGFELTGLIDNSGLMGPDGPVAGGFRGTYTGDLVDVGDGTPERVGDLTGKFALIGYPEEPLDDAELAARIRNLKAKGAIFVLAEPFVADLTILPVIQVWNPDHVARLRAGLAAGPVPMRAEGRRDSPYAYHLYREEPQRVPDGWSLPFTKADLGLRRATYRDANPGEWRSPISVGFAGDRLRGGFDVLDLRHPQDRDEYFSPGPAWRVASAGAVNRESGVALGVEVDVPRRYQPGERTTATWHAAPYGPELADLPTDPATGAPIPWAQQRDRRLTARIPMFGDNDPGHYAVFQPGVTGSTVLFRDGKKVATSDMPGRLEADLPAGAAGYRLVADAALADPAWPLATRVHAEWSWRSGSKTSPAVSALPLLDIRYRLPLDAENAAPAGKPLTATVELAHQSGSTPAAARLRTVEVSYDDGRTWSAGRVQSSTEGWRVTLPQGGAAGGFATLRVTAGDSAGNALTETITRAYRLR